MNWGLLLESYAAVFTSPQVLFMTLLGALGGVLLGVIEIFGKAYISTALGDAIVFAVLIIVLLFKPAGLLGKPMREKV